MKKIIALLLVASICLMLLINQGWVYKNDEMRKKDSQKIQLITLDPGHFHAALIQKSMYAQISPEVHVYAPGGPEVKAHLALIEKYNNRSDDPTTWIEKVYTGSDYMKRMIDEKAGNVVVIAGNNKKKTQYIKESIDAGFNVLADKPMAITPAGFQTLKEAFAAAKKNKVLLYDIMTERYEITNILQKELAHLPEVFGKLEKGSIENPSVTKESVHHFFKNVSGQPLIRPSWFFDVEQEGYGIVDVTTHLVDLVQWNCFPDVTLDYKKDVRMLSARKWPTELTALQFRQVTQKESYPDYLKKDIQNDLLHVFSNGEMNYTIKGIHARVSVTWNFQAPEGTGDTHFSIIRGTKANLVIRQGKDQHYKPVLYIEPVKQNELFNLEKILQTGLEKLNAKYPGIEFKKSDNGWEVIIPEKYKVSHEEHFALVTKNYLQYLDAGKLPDWEVPNMLAKYYTTTQALEKASDTSKANIKGR